MLLDTRCTPAVVVISDSVVDPADGVADNSVCDRLPATGRSVAEV